MALPVIGGFISSSLIEWEGKIASVIFLSGCNFRCPICHSPDLAVGSAAETIPWAVVKGSVAGREGWVDGVVLTGGEPTIQPVLRDLIVELRSLGLKIKLDTNGSQPGVLTELIGAGLLDAVAMDVKAPLDHRYVLAAGRECDLGAIRESIQCLVGSSIDYEFRTTVCPKFLGPEEVTLIAGELEGAQRYVLQPFRSGRCLDPSFRGEREPSREELLPLARRASAYVKSCLVRGAGGPAHKQ